jgi:hypothetical protein
MDLSQANGRREGKQVTCRSKAVGITAATACIGLMLAGCGSSDHGSVQSTDATADNSTPNVAATTNVAVAHWDPCTIPDSAIAALGLNTSTKSNKVAGTTFDGWNVCSWSNNPDNYVFTVYSSGHTLDETKQRSDRQDFTSTTLDARPALQYRPTGAEHDDTCYISTTIPHGTADFSVQELYGVAPAGSDPCAEVRRLSSALAQYLPRSE